MLLEKMPDTRKTTVSLHSTGAKEANFDKIFGGDFGQLMVELRDLVEDWPEWKRAVLGGRLGGMSVRELAEDVGRTERSVYRVLQEVVARWSQ